VGIEYGSGMGFVFEISLALYLLVGGIVTKDTASQTPAVERKLFCSGQEASTGTALGTSHLSSPIAVKGMLGGGYSERIHWRTTVGIKEALASKIQYLGHLCEPSAAFSRPSNESWLALVGTYPTQSGGITWSTGKSAAPISASGTYGTMIGELEAGLI
jgi:hypothetical protein